MGTHWSKLRTDVHVQKQVLTVAAISALMAAFELGFFILFVVPNVRSGMQSLLRGSAGAAVGDLVDPRIRPYVGVPVGVATERERALIEGTNASARDAGIAIVLLPVLLCGLMLWMNPALRRAQKRDVYIDVALVVGALVGFQVLFYFVGQRWAYTTTPEMLADVLSAYNAETCDSLNKTIDVDGLMAAAGAAGGGPSSLDLKSMGADMRGVIESRLGALVAGAGGPASPDPKGTGAAADMRGAIESRLGGALAAANNSAQA